MPAGSLFARRRLEIFFAGQTLVYGLWLMLPFDAMSSPDFAVVVTSVPEHQWGTLFFFNGLCHLLALLVNGHRWWSPFIRWFAALTSMLVYASLALCFAAVDWRTTAVVNYAILSVGGGMCLWTAWRDALTALRVRDAVARYS